MRPAKLAVLVLFLAAIPCLAQSGRRIATPKQTADPVQSTPQPDVPTYSESAPAPTRRLSNADRFPKLSGAKPVIKAKDDGAGAATTDGEDEILKVETDLITIPVSVFDRNGLYIPNLRKEDFTIFEDGKPQEIAYFGTSDKPFTVTLLLDTSPSTEYNIEEIQTAARAFVDQLKPADRVMVIEFDGNVHVLTEPTSDREQIYHAIKKADFGSGTSLYDAVNFSLKKRLNQIEGRKAIVLFTDGVDTTSRKSTYDSTVDLAEESDALIFPIYYNTFSTNRARNGGGFPGSGGIWNTAGTSATEYAIGREYLNELALYTGGRVFRPESTPGGLTTAFEGIAEELRRQYNIGYVPVGESSAGQRKRIKVRVDQPNLVVRSRDSYIVGQSAAAPTSTPTK